MRRLRGRVATVFACAALFYCAGCSDGPARPAASPGAQSQPAKPEPVSAQSAFQKMFVPARAWAQDAQVLRVAEIDVDEVQAERGKAAAWEAVFVSLARRQSKRFVYSVVHRPVRNLRGGVTSDPEEAWSGGGSPFLMLAFKKDSTVAYDVAMKEGAAYAKKHPGEEVRFLLERTRRFPNPAWRVYWGESVSTSGFSVFVDATTGHYLGSSR